MSERNKTLHIRIPLHRRKRKIEVQIVGVRVIPTGSKNFQGPANPANQNQNLPPQILQRTPSNKKKFDIVIDTRIIKLLPPNGVEPVTSALLVPRSTN
jgi:hypothetical protein